jgi:hypothetical protein
VWSMSEEWERREVELTKVAVEASIWQGHVGHRKGCMAAHATPVQLLLHGLVTCCQESSAGGELRRVDFHGRRAAI